MIDVGEVVQEKLALSGGFSVAHWFSDSQFANNFCISVANFQITKLSIRS